MTDEIPPLAPTFAHDVILPCTDCGRDFTFTVDEQRYFWSRRLSLPKRCPSCRAERRARLIPNREVRLW